MINYLKGTLVSKVENSPAGCNITVEVNNIGYLITTNKRIISSLPEINEIVTIYTSLIHKEDTMYLCGFDNHQDRDLFNILQNVSGIGTKVAMLLLGELGAYELVKSVIAGDYKSLAKTKGIGTKLAQRIILELKDKMINWREKTDFTITQPQGVNTIEAKQSYIEAESVLLSLGYSRDEATKGLNHAFNTATNQDDPEELLRISLQWLSCN